MDETAADVDDRRCRFLVRLRNERAAALEPVLAGLAAADRLAALLAPPSAAVVELARHIPTALLGDGGEPGGDGALVDARDAPIDAVALARRGAADAIVVADVGVSRHAAMEAGEAGADAILFTGDAGEVRDCVAWWSELFVLPVAAPSSDETLDALVRAGADFLLVEATWLVDAAPAPAELSRRLAAAEAERPAAPPPA